MKNMFKYITAFAVIFSALSCDEDTVVFDNNTFVQLGNASAVAVTENSGQDVAISVQLGSPQSSDVTVNFDVTGDASRFTLSTTSLVIPAGETSGSITFTPIDDDDINGDVDITIALSDSGSLPVGVGGQGVNSVSKTITIVDDNVPCNAYVITFTQDRWGSEIVWDIIDSNGAVIATDGPFDDLAADGDTETHVVNVTIPDGCYTFRTFDFWGDSYSAGGASYSVVCGSLTAGTGDGVLDGIPGLDLSTVPIPFRDASSTSDVDPYAGHAEAFDFCVNQ